MAYVASNNNENTSLPTTTPFMDPLTHGVIKEASKSLRYYLDVKRRENAFVLSPSSSPMDSVPLKARFIYGTTKEYPPLYGSFHSDNDVKVYLRSFQQQQRQSHSTSNSPEKQMCRKELNFHMRTNKYSSKENQKFGELRLGPSNRSNSSFSRSSSPDFRRRTAKSTLKSSRRVRDQLVDDTADILASMIKTRRSIYQSNYLSQRIPPIYVSRNANPSPRQIDDPSIITPTNHPPTELKPLKPSEKPKKRPTESAASIMYNAKPITKGLLCEYKVSVTTGNCNGASTNAPIRIKLYGTKGSTNFVGLVGSETYRVPFLKDQTDVFIIQTYHVGKLAGITIGHEQKDIRSGWFLDKISIDDPIREMTFEILCNSWLSSKSIDRKTMRDFQVTSILSRKKERREEIDSQSNSSTVSTSNTTNVSQNDQLIGHERTKSHHKQQHVSIGPTTVAEKRTSISETTNHLSKPPPVPSIDPHFNPIEFSSPPVTMHRIASPVISTSSSEAEIEDNLVNHSHSTTPTPSPTRSTADRNSPRTPDTPIPDLLKRHSIDHSRPPARLENRNSPVSASPERPIKNKEETNENDAHAFFDY